MAKLTDWFPSDVSPVKIGVYRVKACDIYQRVHGGECYSFFNGDGFGRRNATVENANNDRETFWRIGEPYSEMDWRGLAVKPKGTK